MQSECPGTLVCLPLLLGLYCCSPVVHSLCSHATGLLVAAPHHFGFHEAGSCYGTDSSPKPLSSVRVESYVVILTLSVLTLKKEYLIGGWSVSGFIPPGPLSTSGLISRSWQRSCGDMPFQTIIYGRLNKKGKLHMPDELTKYLNFTESFY